MLFVILVAYLHICISLSDAEIADGCDSTSKTCIAFSNCAVTTSTTNTDIATIATTGTDTVEFELQFDSTSIGWIAIGISSSASMPNAYIFLCHRASGGSVTVEERKSGSSRSRPAIVTSNLITISSTNSDGVLNCKFTSPITRTPQLDAAVGYYILLARGTYTTNINQHSNRCLINNKMQIADSTPFESSSIPASSTIPSSSTVPSSPVVPSSIESVYSILPTSTITLSLTESYFSTSSLMATDSPTSTIPIQTTSTATVTPPTVITPTSFGTILTPVFSAKIMLAIVLLIL